MTAYPVQTWTTLGRLCAALWDSQSRPDAIQPGFKPGTVVTPLARRCSALNRCLTREPKSMYILQTTPGVEEKFFKTLEELVHHYKCRGQGLVQHLCHLVKRKTLLQLPDPNIIEEVPDYEIVDASDYVQVLPS